MFLITYLISLPISILLISLLYKKFRNTFGDYKFFKPIVFIVLALFFILLLIGLPFLITYFLVLLI